MNGGILDKNGFSYKDENGDKKQINRAEIGFEEYKMDKKQLERKRALLKSCIEAYPDIDKHTINIMVDYFIIHPEKLDADNRLDETNDDYKKYLGEI